MMSIPARLKNRLLVEAKHACVICGARNPDKARRCGKCGYGNPREKAETKSEIMVIDMKGEGSVSHFQKDGDKIGAGKGGTAGVTTIFCGNCGQKLASNMRFCNRCGASLEEQR